jgi:CRISPR-associated protein Csm2
MMPQPYRHDRGRDRSYGEEAPPLSEDDRQRIRKIIEEGDPEALVDMAKNVGRRLKELEATRSQVRNVFGTVRQIQMRWQHADSSQVAMQSYRDTVLLRPKLSYYAKKEKGQKGRGMQYLETVLTPALELVKGNEEERHLRFTRFSDFFEAIVAYHHAAGAKD